MNQFKHISPPPPPPIQQSIDGQPLSPANYEQLEYASRQSKKIRNAAGVAAFNGYTFAIFAAISAMAAAFSLTTGEFDFIGIIITLGLGAIAHNELKGRRMLLNFDRRAPKRLGWNQLALLMLIIFYCTWNIAASRTGQSDFDRELGKNSQFNDLYGSEIRSMEKNFTIAIYGTVIIASIIFQGINAIYYFTRKRIMDEYLSKTPPWAIEVIRRTIRT